MHYLYYDDVYEMKFPFMKFTRAFSDHFRIRKGNK